MKRQKIGFIFSVILFVVIGCKQSGNNQLVREIFIDPNDSKEYRLSELFRSCRFVELEYADKKPIRSIRKMLIDEERIFILNSNLSIFIYDLEGQYIADISRRGHGPGEYLGIYDFILDNESKNIFINDLRGQKILVFDYNGNFLNEWITGLNAFSFNKIDGNLIYYIGCNMNDIKNSRLLFFNADGELYLDYFPITENEANYLYVVDNTNFPIYGSDRLFLYSQNDTIYDLNGHGLSKKYAINFNGKNIPARFYKNNFEDIIEFFEAVSERKYAGLIDNYYETPQKILFTYHYDKSLRLVLVDKKSWETFNLKGFIDDMTGINIINKIDYGSIPLSYNEHGVFFQIDHTIFNDKLNHMVIEGALNESLEKILNKRSGTNNKEYIRNPILLVFN